MRITKFSKLVDELWILMAVGCEMQKFSTDK